MKASDSKSLPEPTPYFDVTSAAAEGHHGPPCFFRAIKGVLLLRRRSLRRSPSASLLPEAPDKCDRGGRPFVELLTQRSSVQIRPHNQSGQGVRGISLTPCPILSSTCLTVAPSHPLASTAGTPSATVKNPSCSMCDARRRTAGAYRHGAGINRVRPRRQRSFRCPANRSPPSGKR